MFDAGKTKWLGYRTVKKPRRYVKPFSSDTGTLRTDRRTDGHTELLYKCSASVCWRAIKIIERVVKSRLSDHLTSNNLVNPHQSAFCKQHPLKLLSYTYMITLLTSSAHVKFLVSAFSAAFDTIDHNILLTRLSSWFGIRGTATGSDPMFALAVFVSNAIMIFRPHILVSVMSPKLSSRPSALCHVYNHTQYSCFISCFKSPPLCRWHTAFLLPSIRFPLQHQSLTKCSTTDLFLYDCQSSHSQLF